MASLRWLAVVAVALLGCSFEGAPGETRVDATPNADDDAGVAPLACESDPNYAPLDGLGLYRLIDSGFEYEDAVAACAADEARLATITGQAHAATVVGALVSQDVRTNACFLGGPNTPCGFVGLRQTDGGATLAGNWRRSDGALFDGASPLWRPGQPDDNGGGEDDAENCAVLTSQAPAGIDDRPCTGFQYPAICECAR